MAVLKEKLGSSNNGVDAFGKDIEYEQIDGEGHQNDFCNFSILDLPHLFLLKIKLTCRVIDKAFFDKALQNLIRLPRIDFSQKKTEKVNKFYLK